MRLLTLLFCALAGAAAAQDYPSKPVRVLVPYGPGGATDIIARIVAAKLTESMGQSFVVENRQGANGNIALEAAAKAAPDGYTLLVGNVSTNAINETTYAQQLTIRPSRDLVGITKLVEVPHIVVAKAAFPASNIAELIALAKKQPGKINYTSAGLGSYPHLDMEKFMKAAGLDMVHVPYKGGAPALADVMGGQVMGMFGNLPEQLAAIRGGKTRALAVSTLRRTPLLPDVPTVAESGYPGFEVTVWYGVVTQSAVPKPILARLGATLLRTLNLPEMKARLAESTIEAEPGTPEQFAAFIASETAKWAKVVKDAAIPKQ